MPESPPHMAPTSAALVGGMLVLPFLAANAIVSHRVEPFFSVIRPGSQAGPFEYLLLATVLGCLPAGAIIAARPLLRQGVDGRRRLYLLNGLVAAAMLALFLFLVIGLGAELYRCEVLRIANCD